MGGIQVTQATKVPSVSDVEMLCPDCGYDLRGSDSARCSECGLDVSELRHSGLARLPWERRRELGAVRAYLRTVWMTTSHPKWFARAALMSGGYADARRFQLVNVVLGTLGLTATALALLRPAPRVWDSALALGIWFPIAMLVGLFLSLLLMTGVPSYFFHPRQFTVRRQNRCVALSYYASAPLVLALPVALLSTLCVVVAVNCPSFSLGQMLAVLIAASLPTCVVAGLVFDVSHAARALHLPARRRSLMGPILAVLWLIILLACLIGLPGLVFWGSLVYFSLQ